MTPPASEETPKTIYFVGLRGLYTRLYAWLLRRMPSERQRLLAVTILAGGICGLAAVAFHLSIMGIEALLIDRANAASGHSWIWWTILSPALGGPVAGVGLTYFAPAAAGSGIPQVKVAYTLRLGFVTVRETIGKFVLCASRLAAGPRWVLRGRRCRCARASAACWRGLPGSAPRMPAHGFRGNGGGHCRGLQRPDRRRNLHAGRTDRRSGPDHAFRRHCRRGARCRGRALDAGLQSRLSRAGATTRWANPPH